METLIAEGIGKSYKGRQVVRGVTLRLRLRKSDGLVAGIDAAVRRLYKDDDKPTEGTKGLSAFSLRLKDHGTAEVAVPPGLDKLLKE